MNKIRQYNRSAAYQRALRKVKNIVGTSSTRTKITDTLIFCIDCGEPLSADFRAYGFQHADGSHASERAFILYPTTPFAIAPMDKQELVLKHLSVGTILWRKEKDGPRYCLFRSRTFPVGKYCFPAGHLEKDEDRKEAALREAYEETGLGVISISQKPLKKDFWEGCRRGSNYHDWYCFVCECIGEPHLCEEADLVGWFTRKEVMTMIRQKKLMEPCEYFLKIHL